MINKKSNSKMLSTLFAVMVTLVLTSPVYAAPTSPASPAKIVEAPTLLQFTSGEHVLGFTPQGMYAATGSHALHVDFVGSNQVQPRTDSNKELIPLSRVVYTDLWEGITLTYATQPGSIYTTTYNMAPGTNIKNIRLHYNAPTTLNDDGTLAIAFETGTLTESAPIAWQDINGQRVFVNVSFHVRGQEVGFALGTYNPRYALVIDPSLVLGAKLRNNVEELA